MITQECCRMKPVLRAGSSAVHRVIQPVSKIEKEKLESKNLCL